MLVNRTECINRLLVHEGGYINHPSDPGGPTNFGITLADYRRYINAKGTAADVRAMNKMQAVAIYASKYWNSQRLDDMPSGVDYALFDYGVNSGIGRSGKVLKRLIGANANTSVISIENVAAVLKRDQKTLIKAICDERRTFLRGLRTYPVFGKGWERRVNEVQAYGFFLADKPAGAIAPQKPKIQDTVPGKGEATTPPVINKTTTSGGGAASGGLLWGTWDWVSAHPVQSVVIVAVIGAVVTVAVRFALNKWRESKQMVDVGAPVVPVRA